ncbi:MAG: hypothetical protein KKD59_09670 [Acidobacteria bacterium]|nr:hypothetical protein [Acidobacteriota bacterium]
MSKTTAPEKASVQKTLLDERFSPLQKYRTLFVGKAGMWAFIKYELITGLFSWIPGALGLFLRRIFIPVSSEKWAAG